MLSRRHRRRLFRAFVWIWIVVMVLWEASSRYQLWHGQTADEADARIGITAGMIFGPIYISIVLTAVLTALVVLVEARARLRQKHSRAAN